MLVPKDNLPIGSSVVLTAFALLTFCIVAFCQETVEFTTEPEAACLPALQSAIRTTGYYQRGQTRAAETQHQTTLNLLRQLKGMSLVRCSFDVQEVFPLDDRKYPVYVTDYSNLAFDEALKTGNIENATALLAQTAGLTFSKNMFPETMRAFKSFGAFFDPYTTLNIYESEEEIVRKAQLFKDVARRHPRFMYRTYSLPKYRQLCEANDCLRLGWEMQEKIKSRLFRAQILQGAILRLRTEDRDRIKELLSQERELKFKRNLFYFSNNKASGPSPIDAQIDTVVSKLISLAPEYRVLSANIPSPSDVRSVLATDETLVSFFFNDNDRRPLYAWIIEPDKPPVLKELEKTSTLGIYKGIVDLKVAIEAGSSLEKLKPQLDLLADQLIVPLQLRPERKLIIAVDQNLSSLPFDLLPWANGRMMDSFLISYVPSASVFYHLRNRKATNAADQYPVDYNGYAYRALPFANLEIDRAATDFGRFPPNIIQHDASEADLYFNAKAISQARFLHLVTHTVPQEGIAGGFYLPFDKGKGEDGKLTSFEIVSKLKNQAELVVLSACQTATSNEAFPPSAMMAIDPKGGDGGFLASSGCVCNYGETFSNLSGSFFAAGSKRLLLTQWNISDDQITTEFVKRLFDLLRDGMKTDAAVREAKRQMRNDKTGKVLPMNWAGFVLAG